MPVISRSYRPSWGILHFTVLLVGFFGSSLAHLHTRSKHDQDSYFQDAAKFITDSFPSLNYVASAWFHHPGIASLLSTLFISVAPLVFLISLPPELSTSSLRLAVAFASGGLLGDVFLHMVPEIFESHASEHHHSDDDVTAVHKGLAIVAGLVSFFVLEKLLRICAGSGASHSHSHHSHDFPHPNSLKVEPSGSDNYFSKPTLIDSPPTLKKRLTRKNTNSSFTSDPESDPDTDSPGLRRSARIRKQQQKINSPTSPSNKKSISFNISNANSPQSISATTTLEKDRMSAILSLIADASHNFTDGLAISSSMYHSPGLGLSTTLAIFCHEIPHEIGDYAILRKNGYSRTHAILAQLATAGGAFLGTLVGIIIEEIAKSHQISGEDVAVVGWAASVILCIKWIKSLLVPFSAGSFIYIATVGVIPELISAAGEEDATLSIATPHWDGSHEQHLARQANSQVVTQILQMVKELLAMLFGVWMMWLFAVTM